MTTQIKSALALLMLISGSFFVNAQEGIPVYSDYLTDNLYLLHPSMAGASNASKVRLTARQQWFDVEDAPSLQTLSLNGRITDKIGVGGILFNDSNGNFSQTGAYATFAYHLLLSRNEIDLNQLSFGLSIGAIQGRLDESTFTMFDPIVTGI
jgi:type IX secretion system PorP/SprF family membrane protein